MSHKVRWFVATLLLTVVLDQITKAWVYTTIPYHGEIKVIPGFFSIVHAQNPGAANGLFADLPGRQYLFVGFALVAAGVAINLLRQLPEHLTFTPAVLGVILGGATGNAIDRLHKQTVTDFLRFYTDNEKLAHTLRGWFGTAEYPSFNVADIALVVGVIVYLLHQLRVDDEAAPAPAPPPSEAPPPA